MTQCSAGWRRAAANLAPLSSLFNHALPFRRLYLETYIAELRPPPPRPISSPFSDVPRTGAGVSDKIGGCDEGLRNGLLLLLRLISIAGVGSDLEMSRRRLSGSVRQWRCETRPSSRPLGSDRVNVFNLHTSDRPAAIHDC